MLHLEDTMAWSKATRAKYLRLEEPLESDLTDVEWYRLAPPLPTPSWMSHPRQMDRREVVNAQQYRLMTGRQWRALSLCIPTYSTVRYYGRRSFAPAGGDRRGRLNSDSICQWHRAMNSRGRVRC